MRIIGLFAMCLWLEACTTTPLFPPEVLKDVEANTFDAKAWKEQTSYHLLLRRKLVELFNSPL